jgi:predicted dehydrogenase
MVSISIIGAGFVADLYLKSFSLYPHIKIRGVFDIDQARRHTFCTYWGVPEFDSMEALFENAGFGGLVLNLTNPHAHYDVSKACLEAGCHVYSEKPLAMNMDDARDLVERASSKGLQITSAPCSGLSETAQTLWAAIRAQTPGNVQVVYAEMDDGFISQAPYQKWMSESGAPWPAEDEFRVGCTVEHAGYYLSWLLPAFGPVRTVVAASACLGTPGTDVAQDFSTGTLFFESGVVARLTCSILAPHNHALLVVGDKGTLTLDECWKNDTPVWFRKRTTLRRRLIEGLFRRRVKLPRGDTHLKIGRTGAAAMNFALGPVEMLEAIAENRRSRLPADFALHMNEITLALQNAGESGGAQRMTTRFEPVEPMSWARQLA